LVGVAEESPLLEAVARERLLKTAGWIRLSGCCGDLRVVEIAMVLQLLVVTSGVCKWSVNPFTNPNPVSSHAYYVIIYS
jgi:hypothetical protein